MALHLGTQTHSLVLFPGTHATHPFIVRAWEGGKAGGREGEGGGSDKDGNKTSNTPSPLHPTFFNGIHKHTHTVSWPRSRVPHKVTSFSTLIIQALTRCLA